MGLAAELAYAYTYGWEREMADWIEFSGAVLFITGLIMLIGSISVGGGETLGEKLFGGSKKKEEKDAKKEAEKWMSKNKNINTELIGSGDPYSKKSEKQDYTIEVHTN